jgi:hypothetical protein
VRNDALRALRFGLPCATAQERGDAPVSCKICSYGTRNSAFAALALYYSEFIVLKINARDFDQCMGGTLLLNYVLDLAEVSGWTRQVRL